LEKTQTLLLDLDLTHRQVSNTSTTYPDAQFGWQESNWLPAPDGPFAVALRIYWPEQAVLDGKWEPSAIEKA